MLAGALQSAAPSAPLAPPAPAAPPAPSSYVPVRVFDTKAGAFVDFEVMLASVAKADVIFVGEQHDDPNTHRLEVAILEGLDRRKVRPVVSLEMFERDVQAVLDSYLSGALVEEEMVKTSRPWPRYATDYRPLIEAAKQRGWIVVAANVPRRIASAVAKSGQAAIAQLTESDRRLVARDLACPHDDYFERFAATMTGHPGASQTDEEKQAMTERFYWAQCVKDETMAESIVSALEKSAPTAPKPEATGDLSFTTTARSTATSVSAPPSASAAAPPGSRVSVISMLPVADLDALTPAGEDLKRADYLVYTTKSTVQRSNFNALILLVVSG